MKPDRIILLALAVALGFGCFLILLPFLPAMIWAAILVYCLWPIYSRFCRYARPVVAAFVITLVVSALVLVPLVHLALLAAKEARESRGWVSSVMQNGLPPAPAFLQKIPLLGGFISDFWNNSADDLGGMATSLHHDRCAGNAVAHSGLHLLIRATHGLFDTVVALLFAFLFFLSGEMIVARTRLVLARMINQARLDELFGLVASTVRGVVFGILGTAAFQGVLYAVGFEIFRAPQPLLLAVMAGLVSIVPAGAMVIYVPLCLYTCWRWGIRCRVRYCC